VTGAPAAAAFIAALHEARCPAELPAIEKRLGPDDSAIGIRMRDLFDTAKAAMRMPLEEVKTLFASPLYEVRMGAFCILDFRAKAPRTDEAERKRLYDLYLGHHDRITTWDMVDRAAPSVVGGYLMGRSCRPLYALAAAEDPLRRRTAVTAPLWFVRWGDDAHFAEVFPLAAALVADPEPVVHKAVGIALKHAGARDPRAVVEFLEKYAEAMPRAALRSAVDKLDPHDRARFTG
jgi:3-methyladenine DNA glycosylase AlkD